MKCPNANQETCRFPSCGCHNPATCTPAAEPAKPEWLTLAEDFENYPHLDRDERAGPVLRQLASENAACKERNDFLLKAAHMLTDAGRDGQDALQRRIDALEAENAALKADAERYRWLRDVNTDGEIVFDYSAPSPGVFVLNIPFDGEPIANDKEMAIRLDAAIDAARSKT